MESCAGCGRERDPGAHFCTSCGKPFAEEASTRPRQGTRIDDAPSQPPGHGPGWYVALAGAVAVLVMAVVVSAMALAGAAPWQGASAQVDPPATSGPLTTTAVPGPPSSSDTSTDPSTATQPTTEPTIEPTTEPTTEPAVGNDVVQVSGTAAEDPFAPTAVDVLTAYFTSINLRDFVTYRSLFASDVQSHLDLDQLAVGYRSTSTSGVRLLQLQDLGTGQQEARVDFTSTQDAQDGPQGETCTFWSIALFLQAEGDQWVIGAPPSDYHAQHLPC